MKDRWLRARAWAGLTEMSGDPMPWKVAARAWVLVYLGSAGTMAVLIVAMEALSGEGIYRSAEILPPTFGAAMFIGLLVRSRRSGPVGRRSVRSEVWAAIIAWVVLLVMAFFADRYFRDAAAWSNIGISVSITTLACAVFVAVTRLPSRLAQSA